MTAVGEGLAANLASEASKGLFLIAKHHIGYCIHFRKHVENFHTELKKLESARNDALGREERARDNNQVITEFTRDWLSKAKDLIDDAQELKAKTEEHSKCCPNCIRRYDFGKKAVKMTTELNKHITDFKSDNFSLPAPPLGIEFYAPKIYTDLQSRREVRDQIWEALKDDQKLRVGVYGMGGSGKTTLVKELGYKAEKEKLFEEVVFVVVSNPPNVRTIQENIASQLGLKFIYNQESDRARELWSRLTRGEKILVILDDVWEKLDDNVIGIPSEDSHKGCRLLITTRMVNATKEVGVIDLNFHNQSKY
ncbi:hypothetical protein RIF29_41058 [Crotalaria pallida]|uniref:NB-ARC domain-containing protein n=1 Tax=Crotalaria pallida TaxID=3830 RepID=A0AAN9HUW2_CROPI